MSPLLFLVVYDDVAPFSSPNKQTKVSSLKSFRMENLYN